MKYEVVIVKEKTIVGKSIVTSNNDPEMSENIGKLWWAMYDSETGYYETTKNRVNECCVGLYSDYTADGQYTVTAGTEVSKAENPELVVKKILSGKYAKFSVHGNMVTAVAKAWGEIWATPLERTFTGDFEEYLPCADCDRKDTCDVTACEDCDIDIYVAIK